MTDETKKLFDAPWRVAKDDFDYAISSASNEPIVFDSGKDGEKNSNRIARLPELYDALMETVYYKCFECMGGLRHNIDLTREELVKNGCPKQNKSNVCIYVKHIELLRKVRDGE